MRRSGGHGRSGPLLRTRAADAGQPRHLAPVTGSREGARARARRRPAVLLTAGVVGTAVLLGGAAALRLGWDDARPTPSAAGARPSAAASVPPPVVPAAGAGPSAAVAAATAADRTAAEARAAMEELLTARADADLALLRSTWHGDEDAASQAARAVASSSSGLSAVLAVWYDPVTATRIRTGLDQQSEASRAYAAAVAAGDVPAADGARARMGQISRDLGEVLDGVTDGRIAAYVPPQDAAQHRAYVDALQAGDAAGTDDAARWLRSRLTREGTALAAGLAGAGPS